MKKIDFNEDWKCNKTGRREEWFNVTIPHDAMLLDAKSKISPGGVNTGWIEAKDYTYEKTFFVPQDWEGLCPILEFEGVYHRATIFVNGQKAKYQHNGYLGFFVPLAPFLIHGGENTIKVEAINHDQPNSRWYSGTGIYRPVWLHLLGREHVLPDGIKITTLEYKEPKISVEVKTAGTGSVQVEIMEDDVRIARAQGDSNGSYKAEISLPGAKCWDLDNPFLYTCKVSFKGEMRQETFGIRLVDCDAENGFRINGKRVILKGACVHHDNGILGACAYDFAERRKIQILKECGFNAVRSAHNPCSKAMLRACDELGMLVVDEYADSWYIHKTKYDYASEVEKNYPNDLKAMVEKDYNHPSVVMYSIGNEVSETAQKKGIELCGAMTKYLHGLDATRKVTCGINIFFNFLSSMGFGVYSDKKAEQEVKSLGKSASNGKKKKAVGSEFFNDLAGIMGAGFMKRGATLPPCDWKTRDAFAALDVAGYNYGIDRYAHDLEKYSNRLILGSETFGFDVWKFWQVAQKSKRVIGDFVWAGMDYLGEVGIGAWEYEEYASDLSAHGPGWVAAGAGKIDLTGKATAEAKYMQVAYEMEKIGIAVVPVPYAKQQHSPSAWRMTNAVESWSWKGCCGKKTKVEVYARADLVELYINGSLVGRKSPGEKCMAIFDVSYHDGWVKAVAYDARGNQLAETRLETANEETVLTLEPELERVSREDGLCYVRMKYTDRNGIVKPLARGEIKVSVEGGVLLGTGNACAYYEGSYQTPVTDTYYGEAMAIIKPGMGDKVIVRAESKYGNAEAEIMVE